jgi:uncharacterized YigZ family protein
VNAPRRYRVPAAAVRVEDRIEHSRFITTIGPANTIDTAKAAIERVRREFSDATHHCSAYVIGPPGNTSMAAASDDGEPAGTAGRPMLKVLLNSDLGDIVAVVTRYYGGVKLGKGGLVRAYSGGVQHALREAATREHIDEVDARTVIPYTALDAVRRALLAEGARIVGEDFAVDVVLALRVPADRIEAVDRAITNATGGLARLER